MADAEHIEKVCRIILSDQSRRVVVVSAPGKCCGNRENLTPEENTKVTDLLVACAEAKLSGNETKTALDAVMNRFAAIQIKLGLDKKIIGEIRSDLEKRIEFDTSDPDIFMDVMKSAGEDNCAKLTVAVLRKLGAEARYVNPGEAGLFLTGEHGNAEILQESYENLAKLKDYKEIVVFPGFFGYSKDGRIVTFPRGGSDITGSILAAAVGAEVYENFTDVDSVCAVDPDIIPDVKPVSETTYREMRELSYAGFHVLHEEAIIPVVRAGIPICIKNTNLPDGPGTKIMPEREIKPGSIVGIAHKEGFTTILVSKYLMNREIGFGRRLLQIFEEEALSFEHLPSGIDNISIILRDKNLDPSKENRIVERIKKDLNADEVIVEHGLALVMIAGEGMEYGEDVGARALTALAKDKIHVEMIDQGASEISMMLGIKSVDAERAVRALYYAFF